MFAYFKSEPTEYVLGYRNGRVFRQGSGLAFWYWKPSASIVLVPTATSDALFVLNETTGNFQAVTLQGQITYRIMAPATIAGLLNFTIDPITKQHLSEDPAKLQQRIVNIVQTHTRNELQQLALEDALRSAEAIAGRVFERMRQDTTITAMGVECLSLFYTAIKATPEMTKALEAEYRETLQKRADQAIYSRRADAVEQERKIKQNELSTAVDLEQRRQQLVELEGANARSRAEVDAETTRIRLAPFQALEPRLVLALAFRDMAANADKIGNLTITTEILEELLRVRG